MSKIVEEKRLCDKETGQILSRTEKELPAYYDENNGYRMMARTKNIRMFPNIMFPKELSRTDMGHLLFLSRFMWANTGVIGEASKMAFKPYGDEQLLGCIGFKNLRRGKVWLERMVKLSMLRSIDVRLPDRKVERQWYINPIYFCPMFLSKQLYLIWRDQVSKHLPEYIKKMFE